MEVRRGTLNNPTLKLDRTDTVEGRTQESTPRLRHIAELDGLRGIAALMVFFHHVCFSSVRDGAWPPMIGIIRRIAVYGANGVEVFFVLSGFLITSILIGDKARSSYYAPFYWKRVLRIMPVYIVMLLYVILFVPHSKTAVWCAVLFVANFSWFFHVTPLTPFWTLAIEEQFYLLWPTAVHRQRNQTLAAWAVGIGLGSIACRLLFAYFGHYNYYFTAMVWPGARCSHVCIQSRKGRGEEHVELSGVRSSWQPECSC